MKNLERKVKGYLDTGILRIWVADPEALTIQTFSPEGWSDFYMDNTPVEVLFPGLKLTPKQIFAKAELL